MPVFPRLFLILVFAGLEQSYSQRVSYIVSFPNLNHHEAQIEVIVSDIPTRTAVFRMSRSSPGRYSTHEFGKNVYDVTAVDQSGKPLTVNRIDGDEYEVPHPGPYVRLKYTLFGNYADGTYAGIDPAGIHLNMPAAFMWMKGVDNVPITIHFNLPDQNHWTIATQLQPTNDPSTFMARNLQFFMDCPVVIGNLSYRNWVVKNSDGKTYNFRIALDGAADTNEFNNFSEKVQRIVRQEQAVYGEVPAYDYGTYTFLASINPYVHGDGMEHRNSTMITIGSPFHGEDRMLGVFAHEFFHCWNVKRIRPRSLEPFNFEKSNMSRELWFAEGFTQYYGSLMLIRAGIGKDTDFVRRTVIQLIEVKTNTPGARLYSPVQASEMAVFTDAGSAVDKTNFQNTFTSYYPYGASIALALDLELRAKYHKTLDDLMQAAWKKFGKPEVPYTLSGLQDVLAAVTDDRKFAQDFFERYIYGHESIDYNPLLAPAGFRVRKANPDKAWIGAPQMSEREGLLIMGNTLRGTPLYATGLDADDKIIAIDNQDIRTFADLTAVLDRLHPGNPVTIRYSHRNEDRTTQITPIENPALVVESFETAGLPVTPAITQFRQSWLGAK
ncbi:MAG TPA: PDZ domain-containing protein [Puia sp.]|jgi:predicted metalloprotease with PDZ domain|nr:PDZ domain-containing protein [Puia sp.]